MTYYALKDSDWAFDDRDEGRAIIVHADTPEEAISKATEMHIQEYPGAGGVTWDVARLDLVGVGDAQWEDDSKPKFEPFSFYDEGSFEPSETHKRIKFLEAALAEKDQEMEMLKSDYSDVNTERARWKDRAETAEAELAKAREALEPLAEIADEYDESSWHWDDNQAAPVTLGDCRRARSVLKSGDV